jgi:two-component system sensor histidine kinase BaeS
VSDEAERLRLRHPQVSLDVEFPQGDLIFAESDQARLRQVLANLLDNAAKYGGEPAQIRLTLTVEKDTAVIRVADSGAGIPAEELPHLFDRFFRGAGTAKRKGLGVGLFLVRQIVHAAGGTIGVTSEPGAGTCFTVRWPLFHGAHQESTNRNFGG